MSNTDVSAANLPDGSVVADDRHAYIKTHPSKWSEWRGTDGGYHGDWGIDKALAAGATVLRYGKEES